MEEQSFFKWSMKATHFWVIYFVSLIIISGENLLIAMANGEQYFLIGLLIGQFALLTLIYAGIFYTRKFIKRKNKS